MLARRIEEASLNAWPALQQILFDGWLLRFSCGYTKRANSINAFYPSELCLANKIDICRAYYQARGLPVVFRITPFSTPPGLDQALAEREYGLIDPTIVMHLDLSGPPHNEPTQGELRCVSIDRWLCEFCRLRGDPLDAHEAHRRILRSIPGTVHPVLLVSEGQTVACGLGVLERTFYGLFDLLTHPDHRNRGHGSTLISEMLRWSRTCGAQHAYLQVTVGNAPARHVYEKLGFRELYRYWYRVLQD
jgi:GNAT superfamily N-acetyltransferase